MLKKLFLLTAVCFVSTFTFAQTLDELKAEKTAKAAELEALADALKKADALKADMAALDTKIKNLSGWDLGALGTLGANFSQFNSWFGAANPDASITSFGATANAFANLQTEKYFWRNGLGLVATKTKLALNEDERDDNDFETTADAVNLTSLFGYKFNSKWAISSLGEYRSTLLDNFNNPGYFDIGAGATWTPIANAVVVFHPLNYNFVMSDEGLNYESSLGCKIVADYSKALPMGIAWKTNLSAFVSYTEPNDYSNWTWTNGLSAKVWKGLGIGVDFGLRSNKQESYNKNYIERLGLDPETNSIEDMPSDDHVLQNFWVVGLSYSL